MPIKIEVIKEIMLGKPGEFVQDKTTFHWFYVSPPEISRPGSEEAIRTHNSDVPVNMEWKILHYGLTLEPDFNIKHTITIYIKFDSCELTEITGINFLPDRNELLQKFSREHFSVQAVPSFRFGLLYTWGEGAQIYNLKAISDKMYEKAKRLYTTTSELYKQGVVQIFSGGFPMLIVRASLYYSAIKGIDLDDMQIPENTSIGNPKLSGIPGSGTIGRLLCRKCEGYRYYYKEIIRNVNGVRRPVGEQMPCNCQGGYVTCNVCRGSGIVEKTEGSGLFKKR